MKENIRPIYKEIRGYLSQAPRADKLYLNDQKVWEMFNTTVDELNSVSKNNFDKFKIQATQSQYGTRVGVTEYRSKLAGLISRIHAMYFNDEPELSDNKPNTMIQQYQQQSQNVHVQILLEIQSLIDKRLSENPGKKEKSFLEKIKNGLSSVKNISELFTLILSTGSSMGLAIDQIIKL